MKYLIVVPWWFGFAGGFLEHVFCIWLVWIYTFDAANTFHYQTTLFHAVKELKLLIDDVRIKALSYQKDIEFSRNRKFAFTRSHVISSLNMVLAIDEISNSAYQWLSANKLRIFLKLRGCVANFVELFLLSSSSSAKSHRSWD